MQLKNHLECLPCVIPHSQVKASVDVFTIYKYSGKRKLVATRVSVDEDYSLWFPKSDPLISYQYQIFKTKIRIKTSKRWETQPCGRARLSFLFWSYQLLLTKIWFRLSKTPGILAARNLKIEPTIYRIWCKKFIKIQQRLQPTLLILF